MKHTALALSLFAVTLTGCTTGPLSGPTYFYIEFKQTHASSDRPVYFIKSSKNMEACSPSFNNEYGYRYWSGHCIFRPEPKIPERITIEYTKWLSIEEQERIGASANIDSMSYFGKDGSLDVERFTADSDKARQQARTRRSELLSQLPPSAWKTLTIYPHQIIKKYDYKSPNGSWFTLHPFEPKRVSYTLTVSEDGSISSKESHNWYYMGKDAWKN